MTYVSEKTRIIVELSDELKAEKEKVAQLEDGYKDILRMASNQGKSPDHEAALIILLNIGDVCCDALADTQERLTKKESE